MRRRYFLLILGLLSVGAIGLAVDWWTCLPEDSPREYVTRKRCRECHEKEYEAWTGSDHDRSMDLATPKTVLGDFNDSQFTHDGVTSKFQRRDDKFYVTTDGADGTLQEFKVKYVFGVRPLQQYLVEFPDGRVQCLLIAWDTLKKEWFHLYPDEKIPAGDELHWTQPSQNWNFMCAACHSTDLKKNYDAKKNEFHTTFSEIDASCESCHGPSSLHEKLADSSSIFWDRCHGYGLPRLNAKDSRVQIETCAPCHSRRAVIAPGHQPGEKFLDFFIPQTIDSEFYYADGQILGEDYVYGSFIQSKMYHKGIRCTDCHDPHTARVKFTDPKGPLHQPIKNRLCTSCHMGQHPAGQYDTPAHHFHPDSSQPGTRCVECHMPETTYMVVDPRRDHSIRIPRPDLTRWLGIPNACNGCHNDESKGETPEWAEAKLEEWYGKRKKPTHFAYAIDAGRKGDPKGEKLLRAVVRRDTESAMVRASALTLLGPYRSAAGLQAIYEGLEDDDGLVRIGAVRGLEGWHTEQFRYARTVQRLREEIWKIERLADPQEQRQQIRRTGATREELQFAGSRESILEAVPSLAESAKRLAPLLSDELRAVRVEAARVMSFFPAEAHWGERKEAFLAALEEYVTGQEHEADRAEAHMNLATVYQNLGENDKAEKENLAAIELSPQFGRFKYSLARRYGELGKRTDSIKWFGQTIVAVKRQLAEAEKHERDTTDLKFLLAESHYSFGLLLAEHEDSEDDLRAAAEQLQEAVRLAPTDDRKIFNYAAALHKLGETSKADVQYLAAHNLRPNEARYIRALLSLYVQSEHWDRAIWCAERLAQLAPDDPNSQDLLKSLKQRKREAEKP